MTDKVLVDICHNQLWVKITPLWFYSIVIRLITDSVPTITRKK